MSGEREDYREDHREDNREREDHREDNREREPYYTEPDDMEAHFDSQDQQREQREAVAEEYYVDAEGVTRSSGSGTKKRMDGKGDLWANAHRDGKILPSSFYFQDIDGFAGIMSFRDDTENGLYFEYCLDSWENSGSLIRNIGYVALFDRKQSESIAFGKKNVLSTAVHLDLASKIGASQPVDPKFFYVVGLDSPWKMIELDICTGERTGVSVIFNDKESWIPGFKTVGLLDIRRELNMWQDSLGKEDQTGRPDHPCDALAW